MCNLKLGPKGRCLDISRQDGIVQQKLRHKACTWTKMPLLFVSRFVYIGYQTLCTLREGTPTSLVGFDI